MDSDEQLHDPVIAEILAELRELRLRVSSDLTAASGAVDDDEMRIASEILDADRLELQRFHAGAATQLANATRFRPAPLPAQTAPIQVAHPRSPSEPRRWRRVLPVLPAIAVIAASATAAAVATDRSGQGSRTEAGTVDGAVPTTSATQDAARTAVAASFHRLQRVVGEKAPAATVIAAARRLHAELSRLVHAAGGDPTAVNAVVSWLHREQRLIATAEPPGAKTVLADTRQLVVSVLSSLPTPIVAPSMGSPSPSPSPSVHGQSSPPPSTSSSPTPTHWAPPSSPPTSPSPSPSHGSGKHSGTPSPEPTNPLTQLTNQSGNGPSGNDTL